jgi:hypothetical protein
MTDQEKSKIVNVAGICGGGLFFVLNLATGQVPGGFVGGVVGYLSFAVLAALILFVFVPKDERAPVATPQESGQIPAAAAQIPVSPPPASSTTCDGCGSDAGTRSYLEHVQGRGYLCYDCRHRSA